MIKDSVAARYAEALFELSKGQGSLDASAAELGLIGEFAREHAELRQLLLNPDVEVEDKLKVLERLMGGAWSGEIRAFVQVVLKLDRAAHLGQMVEAFQELVNAERRVLRVTVRSARPLPAEHRARLVQWIEQREHARVSLTEEVDPALIGGLQVSMGHRTFDGSIKTQLSTLRQRLKQVRVA
jgi:F-type H+-transporting ATPase subunit delta